MDDLSEWPGPERPMERLFVGHIHPEAVDPMELKTVWTRPFEGSVPATLVPHTPLALSDLAERLTRTLRGMQFERIDVQVEAVVACIKADPASQEVRHAA